MRARIDLLKYLIFALYLVQQGSSTHVTHQIVEQLEEVPPGWLKGNDPIPSTLLTFRLAMNQPNMVNFEKHVIDISTPGHRRYGQHMELEEIQTHLSPDKIITNRVLAWLRSENVYPSSIKIEGNWITFQGTISQAEQMLKTEYSYYHHHATDSTVLRTLRYSVPNDIHPHVQLIQPTTRFNDLGPLSALPIDQPIIATEEDLRAECGTVVRPDCLRELYGLNGFKASPSPYNRLGISGFLSQYARHSDFHHFRNRFLTGELEDDFSVVTINGGLNDENTAQMTTEASLDIQYSVAMAHGTLASFYSTGGRAPLVPDADQPDASDSGNEPFLEQLHYLINLPGNQLPAVFSTSYGESEQSVPPSYARAVCSLFAQLGARGVSVIFSSGDSGVGSSCQSNDGAKKTKFIPGFPASCPFVTSVGGTYGSNPEGAADFSGGGFSDLFPRPAYQEQAVRDYLDRLGEDQWKGLYNRNGRGIPDVAAQSKNFLIRDHETWFKISGTR
jgi:tripeptidyl-peptidase-1